MSLSLTRRTLARLAIVMVAPIMAVLMVTNPAMGQSSAQKNQYGEDGGQRSIQGYITDVSGDTVLVEADPDDPLPGPGNPKGSLNVSADTEILKQSGGEFVEAGQSDLEVGQLVEATTTGPVAESYPFQADAGRIVILEGSSGDGGDDRNNNGNDQYDNNDGDQPGNGGDQRDDNSGGGDSSLDALPDTGGAALLPAVGIGVLLIGGGLLARRLLW